MPYRRFLPLGPGDASPSGDVIIRYAAWLPVLVDVYADQDTTVTFGPRVGVLGSREVPGNPAGSIDAQRHIFVGASLAARFKEVQRIGLAPELTVLVPVGGSNASPIFSFGIGLPF